MRIKGINVIETSALCNKKCKYCPYELSVKSRSVGLMTMDTFKKAIAWIKYFKSQSYLKEYRLPSILRDVNLHGLGEALLNPKLPEMIKYAVKECPGVGFRLNTNCSLMTEDKYKELMDAGIGAIDLTDHEIADTFRCLDYQKKYKFNGSVSRSFAMTPHNWCGQIDWPQAECDLQCINLTYGVANITWDGFIIPCCMDVTNKRVLGHVDEDITNIEITPGELCSKCHCKVPTKESNDDGS